MEKKHEAGKGSKLRKIDLKKWAFNYSLIAWASKNRKGEHGKRFDKPQEHR